MIPVLLCLAMAAAAGTVLVPDRAGPLRRLASAGAPAPDAAGRGGTVRPGRAPRVTVVAACLAGVPVWPGAGVLAASAAVAVATAAWSVRRRRRASRADQLRAAVVDHLSALAAELRAGGRPSQALASAFGDAPAELLPVSVAARSPASDPAAALDAAAREPGAAALSDLAAAWRVVAATGAGLAGTVDRLAASARADAEVRREVAAQLAGPRATAALLSALPAAGAGLGAALGADPLGFLVRSGAGQVCLFVAVLLVCVGTVWTEAIASQAEPW